jgi:hypothetical protein
MLCVLIIPVSVPWWSFHPCCPTHLANSHPTHPCLCLSPVHHLHPSPTAAEAAKAERARRRAAAGGIMLPGRYKRVQIKQQQGLRFEEFDFSYYNRTPFTGLENDLANCYTNALLQVGRCGGQPWQQSAVSRGCLHTESVPLHMRLPSALQPSLLTSLIVTVVLNQHHHPASFATTAGPLLHARHARRAHAARARRRLRVQPHLRDELPVPHAGHCRPGHRVPGSQSAACAAAEQGGRGAGPAGGGQGGARRWGHRGGWPSVLPCTAQACSLCCPALPCAT